MRKKIDERFWEESKGSWSDVNYMGEGRVGLIWEEQFLKWGFIVQ
jgi:hypothetical protein